MCIEMDMIDSLVFYPFFPEISCYYRAVMERDIEKSSSPKAANNPHVVVVWQGQRRRTSTPYNEIVGTHYFKTEKGRKLSCSCYR
jgi:hypothetical protein